MPTIVFASSKGGAGKTTAAVILASELARQGAAKGINIALIDADPNQHSAAWANKEGRPENIQLFENATEESILDAIDEAENNAGFVLVDLEGVASSAVIGAVSRADLVVIPCQPSQNDAKEAVKTIKTIQYSARVAGRTIPFAVLFTRLSAAIITKTGKHLAAEFDGAGVELFECSLIDREPFKSVFSYGGTVNTLEGSNKREQESINKAADNAKIFAEEVKRKLKTNIEQKKRAANG
jgi:chromosome partitioning protein